MKNDLTKAANHIYELSQQEMMDARRAWEQRISQLSSLLESNVDDRFADIPAVWAATACRGRARCFLALS